MLAYSLWDSIFRIPQLPIIMGCLIPIVAIIGNVWYKAQKDKQDHDLKRRMLERGMSAEEIERVISAGVKDDAE